VITLVSGPHAEGRTGCSGQAVGRAAARVSVLARLVASVRDGTADRMYRSLAEYRLVALARFGLAAKA
jgi:hypothetical protein